MCALINSYGCVKIADLNDDVGAVQHLVELAPDAPALPLLKQAVALLHAVVQVHL
jgi:hypothetical protein